MNGDSQHLEARPELQDWLQSELFTVYTTGPFSKQLGDYFELYSTVHSTFWLWVLFWPLKSVAQQD